MRPRSQRGRERRKEMETEIARFVITAIVGYTLITLAMPGLRR